MHESCYVCVRHRSSGTKCHWPATDVVCFDFSIRNDIMFNPIKSVCVVFKSKSNKLYCPTVSLDCDILEYSSHTKYLRFTFSMNVQKDDDLLRQMRTLYIRSNKLLRTFYRCSIDVKLELFRNFL